jgi:Ser/Thr protein kinase RdoA (MazF antagonist)
VGGALALVRHLDEHLRARSHSGLPNELLDRMDDLAALTTPFAESAPCHNDLNPGNILETPDAVYFIDWETACASDPFLDLALLGVFDFPTPGSRTELLEAYLARRPSEAERARAIVTRVMALGYYAAAFCGAMIAGGGPARPAASPLPVPEMLRLLATLRERAPAEVVAASLLDEMRRETDADGFESAKRALAAG